MNEKTEGIVLKQSDYKDNDYLLSVITPGYGLISLVARGAKKNSSKNSYACSPLTLADFLFDDHYPSTLHALHSATVTDTYKNIREDLLKVAAANVMLDMTGLILKETEGDAEIGPATYQLLKACLSYLNVSVHVNIALGIFLSNMLEIMGISPQVDGCCVCGNPKIVGISISDGGFVCADCKSDSIIYSVETLRKFRLLNKAKPINFTVLETYEPYEFPIIAILYQYLKEYGDINLTSWTFLSDLVIHK
ncbi:DNA repair protein RecO [bioreactor metagenome]|uniref:DNA repair protein RecO n=1 Tax=bioreactor metagenome TaxID=1076179 RepID=A0A645B6J3_9ZZZZ|nr:DNA repair protein RecO [Erysipelotrichaceae bacterium]